MLSKKSAQDLINRVKSHVSNYAVMVFSATEQNTTRFANSEISQNVSISNAELKLTLYDGKKEASCSTNVFTDEGIVQLVHNAEEMLKCVPDGEFEAFPFSTEELSEILDVNSINELEKIFGITERAKYVKEGIACLEHGYTGAGALSFNKNVLAVANSTGDFRYATYGNVAFNTVVTCVEDGAAGAGAYFVYSKNVDAFINAPSEILAQFRKAQATASAVRNPISPELGAHTVILSPIAFADLVLFAALSLNAEYIEDGSSFATGKLGEKLFGQNVTIYDDITNPLLRPLPFDMEGNVRQTLKLVDKGVISAFAYDNKLAMKLKTKSTGHAGSGVFESGATPSNIVISGGEQSLEEIITSTEKGIFINELNYTNFVNERQLQLTGLTRNGAFLIEGGKLTTPISTVRFTESLLCAFNNITALSKEREVVDGYPAAILAPAARIENFHFTSKP